MNFSCPHCQHPTRINQPKAGRFKPKCPKCKKAFLLTIDNAGKVQIKTIPEAIRPDPSESESTREVDATAQLKGDSTQHLDAFKTQEIRKSESSSGIDATSAGLDESFVDETLAFDANVTAAQQEESGGSQSGGSRSESTSSAEPDQANQVTQGLDETQQAVSTESPESRTRNTIPKRLGGYKLDRQLGKGGMGTVFLATQVSLDREVAIKILKPSLTVNPSFISRFVREAYAAAQLVHHNVVQIYDIGSQGDVHYFSMELVKGDSLAGVLKRQRRLDCDTAAGYILQAARGLKFAHDQGMVHRDVKPANLMLDEHGIVKVADMGLVKIGDDAADENVAGQLGAKTLHQNDEDSQITQFGVSVGTPTYMAPEQWKKSSEVDQRADIYSLGCTFYVLVTGKLPFDGKTPKEVVTKVISEQAVPPELLVKDIPKRISLIVNQMIAKDPKDRYADMGQLISDLEEYLGVSSSGAFSPSERHVEILEKCVHEFNEHPLAKLRKKIFQGSLGLALLLFVGGIFFSPRFAMWVLGTTLTAGLTYFVVRGLFDKTYLFNQTRRYLFINQVWDWITMGITVVVGLVLAVFVMGVTGSLAAVIIGPLLGAGLYFGIDRVLAKKRSDALDEAEKLFKVLRLRGLNEDLLRQFVCRFSGNDWEEFFENLFGYPAKINARSWLKGETGKSRKTFRWWRDPLVKWLDRRYESRSQARQIQHLEKVELQKLLAQGVDKAEAKIRARNIAKLMTENAEAWRQSQGKIQDSQTTQVHENTVVDHRGHKRPTLSNLSRNLDEKLLNRGPKITMADRFHGTVTFFIGPRTRFLVGIILFGLCLWWMQSNGKVAALRQANFGQAVSILFSQNSYASDGSVASNSTQPVPIPLLPETLLKPLNSINHGVVGLLFIYSATLWGWVVTIPMVLGGLIALVAPQSGLIPAEGISVLTPENIALIAGVAVALIGAFLTKPRKETLR